MNIKEMSFADALRRFRKEKGLKQKDVADVLGFSQQKYQAYENKSIPNAAMLKRLSVAFNVSTDYLIGLDEIPRRPLGFAIEDVGEEETSELKLAAENDRILDYHQTLANILAKQGIKI